jgi:hypothetical protein
MSAASYTLEAGPVGWSGALEFDYHNVTERPIALLNCLGGFGLRLEKRQGPAWVPAWSPALLMCLSAPIEIPPGGSHHERLHVFGGYPSSSHHPQFSVEEIDGTYRVVILDAYWDYHPSPPWGAQVPLADRVSEPFELVIR